MSLQPSVLPWMQQLPVHGRSEDPFPVIPILCFRVEMIPDGDWDLYSVQGRKVGEEAGGGFGRSSYCKLI